MPSWMAGLAELRAEVQAPYVARFEHGLRKGPRHGPHWAPHPPTRPPPSFGLLTWTETVVAGFSLGCCRERRNERGSHTYLNVNKIDGKKRMWSDLLDPWEVVAIRAAIANGQMDSETTAQSVGSDAHRYHLTATESPRLQPTPFSLRVLLRGKTMLLAKARNQPALPTCLNSGRLIRLHPTISSSTCRRDSARSHYRRDATSLELVPSASFCASQTQQ
jgi:hypothetical protein